MCVCVCVCVCVCGGVICPVFMVVSVSQHLLDHGPGVQSIVTLTRSLDGVSVVKMLTVLVSTIYNSGIFAE